MSVRNQVSAGGVVYRRGPNGIEVALAARRTQKGELVWGLPKGQIEEGESPEAAAIREAREETGIESALEGSLGRTRYFYVWEGQRVRKLVHMFLLRATGGDISEHDDEMEDVRWFGLDEAAREAGYRGERAVLRRAVEALT